jgi:hypothetical protein
MVNYYLLIAAVIAIFGGSLHTYTFEVWIWPKLNDDCFPSFPFGGPAIVKGFYRTVWHFFTVNFLLTIVVQIAVAFGGLVSYGMVLIDFLIIFWILIIVTIFIVAALSAKPGQSYIKTMIRAFQWVMLLIMVLFMYLGSRVSQ